MIKDCFSVNNFTVVNGSMGSGKTSLVMSWLLSEDIWKHTYENMYAVIPELSRHSMENDIFEKYYLPEDVYSDLNVSVLNEIHEKLRVNSSLDENSIVVIDDFQQMFKDIPIAKALESLVIKFRHLKCTIILLQQNYNRLPKNLRVILRNLICFDVGKTQLEVIFDELLQIKKDNFVEITNLIYDRPHNFMCINLLSKKIYKNFDEIIL